MSAIDKITNKPAKFVINTHWHQDHHGRNEKSSEEWIYGDSS